MSEIYHNVLQHPALALFCVLVIGIYLLHELYLWIFPQRDARNHWEQDIGFKARDPESLYRACETQDE